MQYTLRKVPKSVDDALRRRAKEEGKSLNRVAVEALTQATDVGVESVRRRDLSWLAGTWVEDPVFDQILQEQHRIARV